MEIMIFKNLSKPEKTICACLDFQHHNLAKFFGLVKSLLPKAALVFDSEALFSLRELEKIRITAPPAPADSGNPVPEKVTGRIPANEAGGFSRHRVRKRKGIDGSRGG